MKLYSIGQVSSMIDVPIKTIRYYESIGLISPAQTNENSSYRYYSIDDIFRLDLIRCLGRYLGMPLKTIAEYLDEKDSSDEKRMQFLLEQERDIDSQIQELLQRKNIINKKIEAINSHSSRVMMQPQIVHLPGKELSVCRCTVNSFEEALLQVRKMATLYDNGIDSELYVIREALQGTVDTHPLEVIMGIGGSHIVDGLTLYTFPEGDYIEINYLNREDQRLLAYELMNRFIEENHIEIKGPMIVGGNMIDAYSASSWDYCISTKFLI